MTGEAAIKRIMKEKGITQVEVAERIGKNQSSVAMYLRSGSNMRIDNLVMLADICGYDVVLVDRSDVRNAIAIGEKDDVDLIKDAQFSEKVRDIVAEELAKLDSSTQER